MNVLDIVRERIRLLDQHKGPTTPSKEVFQSFFAKPAP